MGRKKTTSGDRSRTRHTTRRAAVTRRWDELPDTAAPLPTMDPPARGQILGSHETTAIEELPCVVCGQLFAPELPEHKRYGRREECGPCGRDSDTTERYQGEMEWYHKSVPVLHIKGKPDPTTPEEKAKMRRR